VERERPGCPAHPRAVQAWAWAVRAAGFLKRASRWPRALVQDSRAVPRGGFVSAIWPSRRGPRRPAASELAVVRSATRGSRSSNAWPARPRPASACNYSRLTLAPRTLLGAEQRSPARGARSASLEARSWLGPGDREWLESQDRSHLVACPVAWSQDACPVAFSVAFSLW
jgi:hypothetical protein